MYDNMYIIYMIDNITEMEIFDAKNENIPFFNENF